VTALTIEPIAKPAPITVGHDECLPPDIRSQSKAPDGTWSIKMTTAITESRGPTPRKTAKTASMSAKNAADVIG
jgi:hypothetical protein